MTNAPVVLKDRYEVERELGRGGMSVVFLAKDRQLMSKRVVVKVLLESSNQDEWIRRKFLQEMEALARIDHPGVVGVLDTGETDAGKRFLVMQYVEGITLRKAMEGGPLPFARAAAILRQAGQAIVAAHDKGVWHRDLKPENIMLQPLDSGQEHVRLIDFGIAGIAESAFGNSQTKVAGSAAYMAPEQLAGQPSGASDIYALGVIAYEILTGRLPYAAGSMMHLASEEHARPQKPCALRPDLSEAADRALLRALAFRPENRYARATDFCEELAQALTAATSRVTAAHPREGALEMAHVLFMDIAGYSLASMDQQREYLGTLQQVVRTTAAFRKAEQDCELVSLPTGDGMALAFFGDPTAPAQCAFEVASALKSRADLKLRMGIHTGPVYRVADINANANVSGGGINVAQRVMDCGDAGHILVSKAVADVLAQFTQWSPLLVDLGTHPLKHGVEVQIYNLTSSEFGNPAVPSKFGPQRKKSRMPLLVGAIAAVVLLIAGIFVWRTMTPHGEPLQVAYFITVQKWRDGKPFGNPFHLPGEMIFEKDYRIAIEVQSEQSGYLYILNEGLVGATGKRSYALLEPRNGASAELAPSAKVRIPPTDWFRFDEATGKETCYLIWSHSAVPEIERLKTLPSTRGVVLVTDEAHIREIDDFVTKNKATKVEIRKDEKLRQSELRTASGILVHAIVLEHQ
jgi:class 3 adenylate cyclase/tRNA A-37 threonylcarbamoyl transferase component Bud32